MWQITLVSVVLCTSLQHELFLRNQRAVALTDLRSKGFKKIPYEEMPTLETELRLGNNSLRLISANAFSNYSSLKDLGLNYNNLYFIDDTAFMGTQLKIISLKGNRLISLSFLAPVQETLKRLDLEKNQCLQSLDSLDFGKFVKLHKINLSGTAVTHVPDFGLLVPSLKILNLLDTDFLSCDCRLAWLKGPHLIDNLKLSVYPCNSTYSLMDHKWEDIDQSQLVCSGKLEFAVQDFKVGGDECHSVSQAAHSPGLML